MFLVMDQGDRNHGLAGNDLGINVLQAAVGISILAETSSGLEQPLSSVQMVTAEPSKAIPPKLRDSPPSGGQGLHWTASRPSRIE
jgi:hypothetical protein